MREGSATMASMSFCLLSGVKTQENIKITELEQQVQTSEECVAVKDEFKYGHRCG